MTAVFDCPECGQRGCDACGGTGRFTFTGCPAEFAGPEIFESINAAEMYEKGLPPVAGGTLDQAAAFLDACRFIWAERAHWKAELGIK